MASSSSSSEQPTKRMFVLKTEDNEEFTIDEDVAKLSETIKHFTLDTKDEVCSNTTSNGATIIPLTNINSYIMPEVLEYCKKHAGFDVKEASDNQVNEMKQWDQEFIDDIRLDDLGHLLIVANFLSIEGLLDLGCQKVADIIKGKKVQEIRNAFRIPNEFTDEEEENNKSEYRWAFE